MIYYVAFCMVLFSLFLLLDYLTFGEFDWSDIVIDLIFAFVPLLNLFIISRLISEVYKAIVLKLKARKYK
jgi:hypothetical protein